MQRKVSNKQTVTPTDVVKFRYQKERDRYFVEVMVSKLNIFFSPTAVAAIKVHANSNNMDLKIYRTFLRACILHQLKKVPHLYSVQHRSLQNRILITNDNWKCSLTSLVRSRLLFHLLLCSTGLSFYSWKTNQTRTQGQLLGKYLARFYICGRKT